VQSKNLASKILSLTARRLPDDWEEKYNVRPALLESFVQKNLFAGTCYKAANWINVGQTKGRGKLGPTGKIRVPIKDIWVHPLVKKFRVLLKNWFMKGQAEYLQYSDAIEYSLDNNRSEPYKVEH